MHRFEEVWGMRPQYGEIIGWMFRFHVSLHSAVISCIFSLSSPHRLVIFIFNSPSNGHFGGIPTSFQSIISPLQMRWWLYTYRSLWIRKQIYQQKSIKVVDSEYGLFTILKKTNIQKTSNLKNENSHMGCCLKGGDKKKKKKKHSYHALKGVGVVNLLDHI